MSETILTAAYVVWALCTAGALVAHRYDGRARTRAWRHIADERYRLWRARQLLDDAELRRRFPGRLDELDRYLGHRDRSRTPGDDR